MTDKVIQLKPTMKLYRVQSKVREFRGCRDVEFIWFRGDKPSEHRPYAELIESYNPNHECAVYREGHIDELFTEKEALLLKEYLDRNHGDEGTTEIREKRLPVPNIFIGFGDLAVGGNDGYYYLFDERGYALPFKVLGYFDLEGCTLVDGSDVYHYRLWLMFSDGTMRMQTNEEAAAMKRLLP
jgi:hypothetical protein